MAQYKCSNSIGHLSSFDMLNWVNSIINFREILTDTLREIVNNLFKENFYGKKKKTINILTTFFISHKNVSKKFFKMNYYIKNAPLP